MDTIRNIVNRLEHNLGQLKTALDEHRIGIDSSRESQVPLILTQSDSGVLPNNELFQLFFDLNPCWTTLSTFEEGRMLKANKAFFEFTGFRENEVIGKTSIQLGLWPCPKERRDAMRLIAKERFVTAFPLRVRTKSGEIRRLIGSACLLQIDNWLYLLSVAAENPESVAATPENQCARKGARWIAEQRFAEIETAIQTLTDRSVEMDSFRGKISTILEKNIFPFIENLKTAKLDQQAMTYLTIIETNLCTLRSSFPCIDAHHSIGLTPTEIHVIELVRQRKTSKEIAFLLNVSASTISFHRNNIRKKLGLHHKSTSLNSHLQSG